MGRNIAMSLLITNSQPALSTIPSVLLNITQVVTTNDNGTLHLGRDDQSFQNCSTNGDIRSERALLINVSAVNSSGGSLDTQTNISIPSLVSLLAKEMDLTIRKLVLLLESSLILQKRLEILSIKSQHTHFLIKAKK